jgi:LPS export ABC transporter protein LptC
MLRLFVFYGIVALYLQLTFSCENDLDTIRKLTFKPNDPNERTRDLELVYTDSGYAQIQLRATLAETYYIPEKITKFKEGVRVEFFTKKGVVSSTLDANYGELLQNNQTVVRDSVKLCNVNQQQCLYTEELHWNQETQAMYTNKLVRVVAKDGVFYGDGIRTTQDFKKYEFIRPRGTINLK